jgi:hypothetical protein
VTDNEIVKHEETQVIVQSATPMQMIQYAVENGGSLEQIEKLMDLRDRFEAGEARKAYIDAMSKFKAEPLTIVKNQVADYGISKNTGEQGARYEYATLDQVTGVVCPAMSKHNLSHSWKTEQGDEGRITITCIITHALGHSESTSLSGSPDTGNGKNNIQAVGSTVSYLQRYTLLAMTGLATEKQDTDAIIQGNTFITDEQFESLNERLDACGANKKQFCDFMNVKSIKEIVSRDYGKADNIIKTKENKNKEKEADHDNS